LGSDTEVLEHREFDEVPRELISNVEIGEKENQSPDQADIQEVVQRFRIYSAVMHAAQGVRFIFTQIPLSYTQTKSG
jgi:hypothetical protein